VRRPSPVPPRPDRKGRADASEDSPLAAMRPKPLATEMARGFVLYVLRWLGAVTIIDAAVAATLAFRQACSGPRNRSRAGTDDSETRGCNPACGASLLGGRLAHMKTDCHHFQFAASRGPLACCCPPLAGGTRQGRCDFGRPFVAFEIEHPFLCRPPADHYITEMAQ
jgi:hypothetical protein